MNQPFLFGIGVKSVNNGRNFFHFPVRKTMMSGILPPQASGEDVLHLCHEDKGLINAHSCVKM